MNQRAVTFGADAPVNLKPGELALDLGGDYVVTPAGSQPLAPNLTALSGLTGAADRVPYFTGLAAMALAVFTAFGRSLVAAVDSAAARAVLGAVNIAGDAMTGALGINRGGGAINATDLHTGAGSISISGDVAVRFEPVIASPGSFPRTQVFHPTYAGNVGTNAISLQIIPEVSATKTVPTLFGLAISPNNYGTVTTWYGLYVYDSGGGFTSPVTKYDACFNGGGNVGVGTATPTALLHVAGTVKADTSLAIGGGTALTKAVVYTPNLTPANVAANTTAEQTFTVTGLTTGDTVAVTVPGLAAGVGLVGARVSAADTLALTFGNFTAGALAPPAGVYRVIAWRS